MTRILFIISLLFSFSYGFSQESNNTLLKDTILNSKGKIIEIIEERTNSDSITRITYNRKTNFKPLTIEIITSDSCTINEYLSYDRKGERKRLHRMTMCAYPWKKEIIDYKNGKEIHKKTWIQKNTPGDLNIGQGEKIEYELIQDEKL